MVEAFRAAPGRMSSSSPASRSSRSGLSPSASQVVSCRASAQRSSIADALRAVPLMLSTKNVSQSSVMFGSGEICLKVAHTFPARWPTSCVASSSARRAPCAQKGLGAPLLCATVLTATARGGCNGGGGDGGDGGDEGGEGGAGGADGGGSGERGGAAAGRLERRHRGRELQRVGAQDGGGDGGVEQLHGGRGGVQQGQICDDGAPGVREGKPTEGADTSKEKDDEEH
mmetsp:Transcript_20920/g.65470  ORF Transcript_20920/g.65470 Transcript_20920/m.65470 type:complete len:228 (+) Transcript_20920:1151-1834(+)